jgi:hypothetical protein
LSNFFGQKVQEDDFLNNQQQIVQQQQQPTQSVEVEVEPEEPFKEKTSYTLSSVQTNSSNAVRLLAEELDMKPHPRACRFVVCVFFFFFFYFLQLILTINSSMRSTIKHTWIVREWK